ncbi:MAG TPA: MBL fold metallo-hydrolase [Coriobacteriia bacterium]|nr:MBL fold metallo-hydrolase [Coriobacteriia bacterium]
MRYTIHRGQSEIGGMCIEVTADDGTRILLDFGMPLYDETGADYPFGTPQRPTPELLHEGVLRDITGLYAHDPTSPDIAAIVLTHAHIDHYGLAHHAHPAIPVYGSRGTLAILEVGEVFFPDAVLPADLRLLPDDASLQIGSIAVTGIPVDHAAPDSRALLVEADGQKLIYSGDLRAHGRTAFRFDRMLADLRLKEADWLLLEGTTLGAGGDGHGLRTEQDVEEELVTLGREQRERLICVVASGQNLDRVVSCFRAAKRTGRSLVIDPYQAYVLMKLAPLSERIPQFTWGEVLVSFAPHQVERLKSAGMMDLVYEMGLAGKASSDMMAAEPGRYLLCARGSFGTTRLLSRIGANNIELVWSLWSGYWTRGTSAMRKWAERESVVTRFIHSGGHAWPEDLERLAKALRPRNLEIVHTAVDCDDTCA